MVGGFLNIRGGGERFILETTKGFLKRGLKVRVFCHRYNSNEGYEGFQRVPIESMDARTDIFGRFRAYYGLKNIRELVLRADRWGADVIFLQIGYIFSRYLQRLTKKRIVSYVHFQERFEARNESGLRDFYRRTLKLSDSEVLGVEKVPIICNSHHTEQIIRRRFPDAENVFVVYPGADLDRFRPTWNDLGYLYYHSRYGGSKNQKLAVEIASQIKYPIVLAGFLDRKLYGDYYDELVAHKPSNVTMLNNVSDDKLLSYLQNCSIFLYPSVNEHFGMATVEAMACGKPVIGHNSGATPEVLSDCGFLCGDDVREWIEKINCLMADRKLRQELGAKSHETAKRYSWDHTVAELERIFHSALR